MKRDIVPGTDYIIYQNEENFKYTTDSLILSSFSRLSGKCADLGSGNGLLSFRLIDRSRVSSFINVEFNENSYKCSLKSAEENGLSNKISGLNIDLRDIKKYIAHQSIDSVIMNPPYFSNSLESEIESIRNARHTDELEIFINASAHILKNSGKLYMVMTSSRLIDVVCMLRDRGFEPKKLRFVKKDSNSRPKVVLIEAVKQGKSHLIVERDFLINSDELKRVYENEEI